jgi:nucleotide-binding universal stress UspA family protein
MRYLVWAIDVRGGTRLAFNAAARAIAALTSAAKRPVTIEPVYIYSPFVPLPRYAFDSSADPSASEANQRLTGWLAETRLSGLTLPRLLVQDGASRRTRVRTLLDYARSVDADLVVVGTEKRRGLSRFFKGSFAEAVASQSDIPVLILAPDNERVSHYDSILFPTDFSDESKAAFDGAVELARDAGLSILLYYKTPLAVDYVPTASMVPVLVEVPRAAIESHQADARRWIQEARAAGIEADVRFDSEPGNVERAVLDLSLQTPTAIIALAARTSSFGFASSARTLREIVRNAERPVWVVQPPKARAGREAA